MGLCNPSALVHNYLRLPTVAWVRLNWFALACNHLALSVYLQRQRQMELGIASHREVEHTTFHEIPSPSLFLFLSLPSLFFLSVSFCV
jgi:hypothetical protein